VEGRSEEAAEARAQLEAAMGKEAVVDAAAVAAAFHFITRGVDTAGHASVSHRTIVPIMHTIARMKNILINLIRSLVKAFF
jgi:hypothetical protein